jgi:AAA ATPase domain
MKLETFQITNFRSINDSGPVTVAKMTSLVGRNESGKSNLLLALRTLNPPGGIKDLNRVKDFPKHKRLATGGLQPPPRGIGHACSCRFCCLAERHCRLLHRAFGTFVAR